MAKKIVNQYVENINSNEELELLYLYEQLINVELIADPKNIQSFFYKLFELEISDDHADRLSERIIRRITRIRMRETGFKLKKKGYKSHEINMDE